MATPLKKVFLSGHCVGAAASEGRSERVPCEEHGARARGRWWQAAHGRGAQHELDAENVHDDRLDHSPRVLPSAAAVHRRFGAREVPYARVAQEPLVVGGESAIQLRLQAEGQGGGDDDEEGEEGVAFG